MTMTTLRLTSHDMELDSTRAGKMNAITCGMVSPLSRQTGVLCLEVEAEGPDRSCRDGERDLHYHVESAHAALSAVNL